MHTRACTWPTALMYLVSYCVSEWVHIALVYYGPDVGISVYLNGDLTGSDFIGSPESYGDSFGNVVLGNVFINTDNYYGDFSVDELYFWNKPFGALAIQELYNSF